MKKITDPFGTFELSGFLRNEQNRTFYFQNSYTKDMLSFENLMKEIWFVVIEKYLLKIEKIQKWWASGLYLNFRNSDGWNRILFFLDSNIQPQGKKISVEDREGGREEVVFEEFGFNYPRESKSIARSGVFGLSGFRYKRKNWQSFNRTVHYENKVFDWDLDQRTEPCIFAEKRVSALTKLKTDCTFCYISTERTLLQKHWLQRNKFWRKLANFGAKETSLVMKLIPDSWKKFRVLHLQSVFPSRLIFSGVFWKMKNFPQFSLRYWIITMFFSCFGEGITV